MSQSTHPKMNLDLFATLPSEIIIDILSRLPVRTIIFCKCVRKSWLELVGTHLSKGVPVLAVYWYKSNLYEILDFGDGLDIEHTGFLHKAVISFSLPYHAWINGSASGLLFLINRITLPHSLYICNPITHAYIKLLRPLEFVEDACGVVTYGFGVSKITGRHKVVRILRNKESAPALQFVKIRVYTIGTGSWRTIYPVASLVYDWRTAGAGAFFNGNLHWLVSGSKDSQLLISCFDLETELFNTFAPPPLTFAPPPHLRDSGRFGNGLFVLGDCLCLCDNTSDNKIVIWLLKKYGVEESWTKEFVIDKNPVVFDRLADEYDNGVVYPVKVFKNGDILMALEQSVFFYYSKKDNTTQKFDMFDSDVNMTGYLLTPSLLPLRRFFLEDVRSF